ncbi:hypothetical protein Taro_019201 [Colocasia esculenta]|uniref:Uncharacterized protein n=1 Tax=Colocasia esculenta TaxID=4460 RepID=A0A843V4T6_COLES|nr:hypothetical protein [Colocasia esculenta]
MRADRGLGAPRWEGQVRGHVGRRVPADLGELQVDVAGEIASLRALLHLVVQDWEAAQRQVDQLRAELERVRRAQAGASSSTAAVETSQSDLEIRLVDAVKRAEEAQADLAERVTELETTTGQAAHWR